MPPIKPIVFMVPLKAAVIRELRIVYSGDG